MSGVSGARTRACTSSVDPSSVHAVLGSVGCFQSKARRLEEGCVFTSPSGTTFCRCVSFGVVSHVVVAHWPSRIVRVGRKMYGAASVGRLLKAPTRMAPEELHGLRVSVCGRKVDRVRVRVRIPLNREESPRSAAARATPNRTKQPTFVGVRFRLPRFRRSCFAQAGRCSRPCHRSGLARTGSARTSRGLAPSLGSRAERPKSIARVFRKAEAMQREPRGELAGENTNHGGPWEDALQSRTSRSRKTKLERSDTKTVRRTARRAASLAIERTRPRWSESYCAFVRRQYSSPWSSARVAAG